MNTKDVESLQKFGKIETMRQRVTSYEFLITDGFSIRANNTFECMQACMDIAKEYKFIQKFITKHNFFHLILTTLKN